MFNKEEEGKEGKFLKSFKSRSKFFQRSPIPVFSSLIVPASIKILRTFRWERG